MIRLEKALDECLERLKSRFDSDILDDGDDLDSIASSGIGAATTASLSNRVVRFTVQERQVERLKQELKRMEKENLALRQQISELKKLQSSEDGVLLEEKKGDERQQELRRRTPPGSRQQ